MEHETVNMIVVGGGWNGISIAKTYREANPEATIRIVDIADSVGGVWAAERLYPGLKTNNVIGSYEFSDFPMTPSKYGVAPGQHIPGAVVHQYLCDVCDHYGIRDSFMLSTKVNSAVLLEDSRWQLDCASTINAMETHLLVADKLVIATGLASEPSIPTFAGQDRFQGKIVHSKQLKRDAAALAKAERVVVLGGNKSSWDVCYSVARTGRHAQMVLRPHGHGPSWVWPKYFGPMGWSISRLAATRFCGLFDPWPFAKRDAFSGLRQWLHKSSIGQWIVNRFWKTLGGFAEKANGYANDSETAKLTPWASTYWLANSLGVHNYETSWFSLVRSRNITVRHAEVVSLSEHGVHFSDGSYEPADALACCTGWKTDPTVNFMPVPLRRQLGLPVANPAEDFLVEKAQSTVLSERPMLRKGPRAAATGDFTPDAGNPYRLYRYSVPSSPEFIRARNIAFMGMHQALHTTMVAQAQALWITAFFQDGINHLQASQIDEKQVQYDTILQSEYQRLRRPHRAGGAGARYPDMTFDSVLFVDLLLNDLNLRTQRKKTLYRHLFEPYGMRDYTGLVPEWKTTQP